MRPQLLSAFNPNVDCLSVAPANISNCHAAASLLHLKPAEAQKQIGVISGAQGLIIIIGVIIGVPVVIALAVILSMILVNYQ